MMVLSISIEATLESLSKKKNNFVLFLKNEKKTRQKDLHRAYSDQIPSKICLQLEYHFDTVIKKLPPSLTPSGKGLATCTHKRGLKKKMRPCGR
jgi:hypothetical protein